MSKSISAGKPLSAKDAYRKKLIHNMAVTKFYK